MMCKLIVVVFKSTELSYDTIYLTMTPLLPECKLPNFITQILG